MKKRGNDTHKLASNDGQGTLSPQLLTEDELAPVTGGTSTYHGASIGPPRVYGELGDDQITISYPEIGRVPFYLYENNDTNAVYQCGMCADRFTAKIGTADVDLLSDHTVTFHLGDGGDGQGRHRKIS
jgi:hypothetical protein